MNKVPLYSLLLTGLLTAGMISSASLVEADRITPIARFVAIDNVCAWPNLTLLPDGTITAVIFNQPSHARAEGDVECWSSTNGEFWKKAGTATAHDPMANRMNVGAGLNKDGKLVVLASGWSLKPGEPGKLALGKVLSMCGSTSKDGHRWKIKNNLFPAWEEIASHAVPFGDIFPAGDSTLRAAIYGSSNHVSCTWMVSGDADGKNWKLLSLICNDHNETTLFPVGPNEWLAASRHSGEAMGIDLYRSRDDGKTWDAGTRVSGGYEGPADIIRLADGRLLLACGNRNPGHFGVTVRFSNDNGLTWTAPRTLVDDLLTLDCGYPSSVQRADGNIVTAYYSHFAPDHQRYHMGVVIWSPNPDIKLSH